MWWLGFDPATKTLGFTLSYIDENLFKNSPIVDRFIAIKKIMPMLKYKMSSKNCDKNALSAEIDLLMEELLLIQTELRNSITIEDGAVVDLFPGINNTDITVLERVNGLVKYIRARVFPIIVDKSPLNVVIEYQMGPNTKSGAVEHALMALFYDHNLITVYPGPKNKLCFSKSSHYSVFSQKYAKSADANKHHAVACMSEVQKIFNCKIVSTTSHVADSFLQIFAYLLYK